MLTGIPIKTSPLQLFANLTGSPCKTETGWEILCCQGVTEKNSSQQKRGKVALVSPEPVFVLRSCFLVYNTNWYFAFFPAKTYYG